VVISEDRFLFCLGYEVNPDDNHIVSYYV